VLRRATAPGNDHSRDPMTGFSQFQLDTISSVLATDGDYDEPLPCRPVLIAQRFDDIWRAIRRQDLEIKSLTNRSAELTDTFALEIDDFI
jgi:hypothetical protein